MFKANPNVLRRLRKYDEIVKFNKISYEEISRDVDKRNVLLKFQERVKHWKSKSLLSSKAPIRGFEQSFLRIYDTEEDVFVFMKTPENKKIDVQTVLNGEWLWNGNPDDLTAEIILGFCDKLIEAVSVCKIYPSCGAKNRRKFNLKYFSMSSFVYKSVILTFSEIWLFFSAPEQTR